MKQVTINKKALVEVPKSEQHDGIVAFQLVEFIVDFFGNKVEEVLDTKIMEDGRQLVISGNGFIPDGYEVA